MDSKLVSFCCPFCGDDSAQVLYSYDTYAGPVLGDLSVTLVTCLSCNFVYNSPRPVAPKINQHYESASSGAVFHESHDGSRYSKLDIERTVFIEKHSALISQGKCIDVGCGQGSLLRKLRNM